MAAIDDGYFYEPTGGHGLAHDPFPAIVAPRPIGWISSRSADGCLNLAPYSFFNAFNYRPPIIGFASVGRKDSLSNIEAVGEFAWSLASEDLAEAMNATSLAAPPEVDEFKVAGLTPAPSRTISVPRVAEARASLECRLTQILRLRAHDGRELKTWLVLGEVTGVHLDRTLIEDGTIVAADLRPVLRAGGSADYVRVEPASFFRMPRPADPA